MSTITEREALAREHACPRCHAEADRPCKTRQRPAVAGHRGLTPGIPMKGVHPERLALLPFELNWHRAGKSLYRAIDNRVTPHVVYEIGRDPEKERYGSPWYLACWREGVIRVVQRHTALSEMTVAKRLASNSRCSECWRFVMFGDLEHKGKGFWQCRNRAECDAIKTERDRRDHEQLEASERKSWDEISIRQGRVVQELVFTEVSELDSLNAHSTVVRATPADVDRLWTVLTRHRLERDAQAPAAGAELAAMNDEAFRLACEIWPQNTNRPQFDVDVTPSTPGPDWEWPDGS